MRILRTTLAVSVLTLLTLTGCASDGMRDSVVSYPEASVGYDVAPDMMMEESAGAYQAEPDVITTGYLTLIVDSPSEAADEITNIVTDSGGRIASRSDYTPVEYSGPSSYLEARIPSDDLDATLEQIKAVGDVQEVSINVVDVSLQKVDLDARIEVLEAAIARLTELVATAETTTDLVAIETGLSERQAELDSLTSQREYLSDQTLFATISITLQTPVDAQPVDPDGFFDGIVQGWESILAFFAGLVVWAGILVPWLGLLVVVVGVLMLIRVIVKKAKNKA